MLDLRKRSLGQTNGFRTQVNNSLEENVTVRAQEQRSKRECFKDLISKADLNPWGRAYRTDDLEAVHLFRSRVQPTC